MCIHGKMQAAQEVVLLGCSNHNTRRFAVMAGIDSSKPISVVEFVEIWNSANSIDEVAKITGITARRRLYNRAVRLRNTGKFLKTFKKKHTAEQKKEADHLYYQKNREYIRKKSRDWYQANKERVRQRQQTKRDADPEAWKAYMDKWRKSNKDKTKAHAAKQRKLHGDKIRAGQARCYAQKREYYLAKEHERKLKKSYGMTPDDYTQMLFFQGGVCAICGKPDKKKLAVDHCHKTGKIRGLLCSCCNTVLGLIKDDPGSLKKAIEYLEDNNGKHV